MNKPKPEPWAFVVIEQCEDYEQILALDVSESLPAGGILTWASGSLNRVFFPTRKTARAAIDRTEHYRLAFRRTDLPEKALCRIEVIANAEKCLPE